jgi:hypothetical protein
MCLALSHVPAIVVSEANLRCKANQDSVGGAALLSFKMRI